MALAQRGTPTATAYTTVNGSNTATNTWDATQARQAGDVLVMVITAAATTSVTAPSAPSGWTQAVSVGNFTTSPHAGVFIFWKIAGGGDTAPSATVTTSGTTRVGCTLFDLTAGTGVQYNWIDQTGTYASGSASATIASMTATTSGSIAYTGEFAIAAFARERTAGTILWTPGTGFSNFSNDGTFSAAAHNAVDISSTVPTTGATLSDAASITSGASAYGAGGIATFAAFTPVYPLRSPVAQGITPSPVSKNGAARLPARGRTYGITEPEAPNAPPSYSSGQPAGVRVTLQRTGSAQASVVRYEGTGPRITPPHGPVRARQPLPPHGRTYSRPGTYAQTGPPFRQMPEPHAAVTRPLPARGRSQSSIVPPAAPVPAVFRPAPQPARARLPQPTWRGTCRAMSALVTAVVPGAAPFTPQGLIAAKSRGLPPRGQVRSNRGVFSQSGPAVTPLQRPVRARQPLPRRGSTYGRAGTYGQLGPQSRPFTAPVTAKVRVLPPRGRNASLPGTIQGAGAPLTQLRRPVQARRPFAPHGRAQGRIQVLAPVTPVVAAFYPVATPARARIPQPSWRGACRSMAVLTTTVVPSATVTYPLTRPVAASARGFSQHGRSQGRTGTWQGTGTAFTPLTQPAGVRVIANRTGVVQSVTSPQQLAQGAFYPLNRPAAAVVRPLPQRGRTASRAGAYDQAGPQFRALNRPVAARLPLPPRGTAQWRYGTLSAPALAAFYPLHRPATAAVRPLPARGRAAWRTGTVTAPHLATVRPLSSPVAAVIRPLPQRGRSQGHVGLFQGTGPAVRPLQGPVRARQPLPPRGSAQGRAGKATPPQLATAYPLGKPVAAIVRPVPPRGRAQGRAGFVQHTGSAVKPLQHPVYAWRPGPRRGVCLTSVTVSAVIYGPPFYPFRRPVQARQPYPPPGRGLTTPPYVVPAPSTARDVTWFTGPPSSGWVTGKPYSRTSQNPAPRSGWTESGAQLQ